MTVPAKKPPVGDVMESVILKGDISKLTPDERVRYYTETCRSLGLNPLTRPFEYIKLQGKEILYARRDACDQLRKIHGINIAIVSQDEREGILSIHVRATDATGRADEDLGVVAFGEQLRGEVRANAIMRAVTKAKRRVTLSIAGLGLLDEAEIADIPAEAKRPAPPAPNVMNALLHDPEAVDIETGEIKESAAVVKEVESVAVDAAPAPPPSEDAGAALSIEDMAREAAKRGWQVFRVFWRKRTAGEQQQLLGWMPGSSPALSEELRQLMSESGDPMPDLTRKAKEK
jgi:hypothetical protein